MMSIVPGGVYVLLFWLVPIYLYDRGSATWGWHVAVTHVIAVVIVGIAAGIAWAVHELGWDKWL